MRRVYPHEVALVEHIRYLEAGGRMEFLDWLELRKEHREMLLALASTFDDIAEADQGFLARMSELEALLGY